MPEEIAPEVTPEAAPPAAPDAPKTFTQEDIDRIVQERLARAKPAKPADYDDLAAKAAKFDQAEQEKLSAEQRAQQAAEQAIRDAESARAETLRYKAAATHKVDPDNFDLLGSGSEDEVMGRAERVGALLAASTENVALKARIQELETGTPGPAPSRPIASLQPGAAPVQIETEDTSYPAHWINQ